MKVKMYVFWEIYLVVHLNHMTLLHLVGILFGEVWIYLSQRCLLSKYIFYFRLH